LNKHEATKGSLTLCVQTGLSRSQWNLAKSQENHALLVAILCRYASETGGHPDISKFT